MKEWVIPPEHNGAFVAAMEQVLDVYQRPYDAAVPVVCMDESPKQLVQTARPTLAMRPGAAARQDCDYIRHGQANVFIASEPLKGVRHVEVRQTKTKKDWALFVEQIVNHWYKKAKKVCLVLDNLATHTTAALYETFTPQKARAIRERLELVYTPVHGSWLNMAEIELHVLKTQCLNRPIHLITELKKQINAWQEQRNSKEATINWQFTTKDARIKLKRLYPSIDD